MKRSGRILIRDNQRTHRSVCTVYFNLVALNRQLKTSGQKKRFAEFSRPLWLVPGSTCNIRPHLEHRDSCSHRKALGSIQPHGQWLFGDHKGTSLDAIRDFPSRLGRMAAGSEMVLPPNPRSGKVRQVSSKADV